ncbi:MAG: hypothetical protein AAGJ37_13465 [Pseudomonadota bacterium]
MTKTYEIQFQYKGSNLWHTVNELYTDRQVMLEALAKMEKQKPEDNYRILLNNNVMHKK